MMKLHTLLYFLLLAFFISTAAQAEMVLNKIIINFQSGKEVREDIEVFNNGKENLYISTKLFAINQPENDTPERKELTDPRSAGIIISPTRFIVAPGGRKVVRLITTEVAVDKDKVYRILMKPHAGKFNLDSTEKVAGVKIILGYELLVLVRPATLQADLQVQRQGKRLNLYNAGNTNVNVREVRLCPGDDRKNCEVLGGKRLYAGQKWQVELPRAEGTVVIRKSVGSAFSVDEY